MKQFLRLGRGMQIFAVVVMLNFVTFFVACMLLGGDALNGHVEAGHYFLGSHGKMTETTAGIYRYSQLHAISNFFTVILWLLVSKLLLPADDGQAPPA